MENKVIEDYIEDIKKLEKHNIKTITITKGFISKEKEEKPKTFRLEHLPRHKRK